MAEGRRQKVSMQDVGNAAGVSPATVSMALSGHPKISEDTRLLVLRTCRELGYPIEKLRRRPTGDEVGRYAFLVFGTSREDAAMTGLVHDSASIAAARGIALEIAAFPDVGDVGALQTRIRDYIPRCNGLFVSGIIPHAMRQTLADLPVPCVVLGNVLADTVGERKPFLRAVVSNEMDMGRTATLFLLGKKHTRIAFLCAAMPPGLYASRWHDGYRLALSDTGLPVDRALVRTIRSDAAEARAALNDFARMKNPPTAFVIPDALTLPCLLAAGGETQIGIAPGTAVVGGDVDVFGFGNYPVLTEDGPAVIAVGLDLLGRMRSGDEPPLADVIVPYRARNIAM